MSEFASALLHWAKMFGRHTLPWQCNKRPYEVWISEIMLQQTQVTTVIPYFTAFIKRFPTVASLAMASVDEVLHLWAGLGYYSRATNLHKAAQLIVSSYNSRFPETFDSLISLPGIGRSTAGAILSLALNQPYAILDGNVKRVLTRYYAVPGWPGSSKASAQLWALSQHLLPSEAAGSFNQALMDLGSLICTRMQPQCPLCPLRKNCQATAADQWKLYPYKKPRAQYPRKIAYVTILQTEEGVWLEQKKTTGVWKNLFAFPQFESRDQALEFVETHLVPCYKTVPFSPQVLPVIEHKFTHFQLGIYPLLFKFTINKQMLNFQAREGCWYNLNAPLKIGLPAPIKRLVKELYAPLECTK